VEPPPAGAGGFQTAGLIACPIILDILAEGTLTFLSGKGKNLWFFKYIIPWRWRNGK